MIDTIYNLGADAMDNQASVVIDPINGMTHTDVMKFRISTFKIPKYGIEFYDISHKGHTISRAKKGNTEEKTLTLPFRVDRNWEIYKELKNWGKAIYDHEEGDSGLGDIPEMRTRVTVIVDEGPTFIYEGCIFSSLPEVQFDQTSEGEPITVDFEMKYLKSYEKK